VCDRIKQILPDAELRYVLSLENSLEGHWMKLTELASSLDIYHDSHIDERPRHVNGAMGVSSGWTGNAKVAPPRPPPPRYGFNKANVSKETRGNPTKVGNASNVKRCFICNSTNHLANYHKANANAPVNNQSMKVRPVLTSTAVKQSSVQNTVAAASNATVRNDVNEDGLNVYRGEAVMSPAANDGNAAELNRETNVKACVCDVLIESCISPRDYHSRDDVTNERCLESVFDEIEYCDASEISTCNFTSDRTEVKTVDLAPLRYVDVQIGDGTNYSPVVSGLYDTGAEIPLAHPRILQGLNVTKRGSISIRSAVGESVKCELYKVVVRRDAPQGEFAREVTVMCAVTEKANEPLILTAEVIDRLMSLNCCVIESD
jgi:hypothetical protein